MSCRPKREESAEEWRLKRDRHWQKSRDLELASRKDSSLPHLSADSCKDPGIPHPLIIIMSHTHTERVSITGAESHRPPHTLTWTTSHCSLYLQLFGPNQVQSVNKNKQFKAEKSTHREDKDEEKVVKNEGLKGKKKSLQRVRVCVCLCFCSENPAKTCPSEFQNRANPAKLED